MGTAMSEGLPSVLLFTGRPGIGKTTLLKTVVSRLDSIEIAGFYSSEIRIDGHRQGFQIEMATTGEKGLLASPDIPGEVRFGTLLPDGRRRLGVSLDFLETVACPAISELAPSAGLFVIDEIGPMQACSPVFRSIVEAMIEQRKAVIASIAESDNPWISSIRDNPGVAVFEINRSNRNILAAALAVYLSREMGFRYRLDTEQQRSHQPDVLSR